MSETRRSESAEVRAKWSEAEAASFWAERAAER